VVKVKWNFIEKNPAGTVYLAAPVALFFLLQSLLFLRIYAITIFDQKLKNRKRPNLDSALIPDPDLDI
jgi:hypothetical protein